MWSVTVCVALAVAGKQQQTNNAAATALILAERLTRNRQVDMLPLKCTVTEPLRR